MISSRIRNPKPRRVRLTMECPAPMAKRIRESARQRGVSVGREIRRLAFQGIALR